MITTLILPFGLHNLILEITQHMLCGLLQSQHLPVAIHGVVISNLCAFIGAAIVLALVSAS